MTTGNVTGTEQSSNVGSVVIRKALGRQLKALRLAAGKTPADIELSGIAGPSKLRRLEAGTVPVKIADVWALCRLYNADSVTTDKLADMAKTPTSKGGGRTTATSCPRGSPRSSSLKRSQAKCGTTTGS